jgi:hypothetical protein
MCSHAPECGILIVTNNDTLTGELLGISFRRYFVALFELTVS